MIDNKSHRVAWSLLVAELEEAREHLESLIAEMSAAGQCDEGDFRVALGHVYAHLNRAWHSRNTTSEISDDQWSGFGQFPTDIEPLG